MSLLVVKDNIVAALHMKGWYDCSLMCSYALATFIYVCTYNYVFHSIP